jgi:hypothetical protein
MGRLKIRSGWVEFFSNNYALLQDWLKPKRASRLPTARQQQQFQLRSRRALRCTILRTLLQEDYRGFSCALAGSPLYQWFCLVDALDEVTARWSRR